MENKNYIIAIDLGSSSIVGAVGRIDPTIKSVVLDKVAQVNTIGMYQGNIDSADQIKEGLKSVIEELSTTMDIPIQDIYLSHSNLNVGEAFLQSCMPDGIAMKALINPTQILCNGLCNPDDLKQGLGIINIGAEYTQIGIYAEGKLAYSKSFACGGQWISGDIAQVCKEDQVSPNIAELIKKQVGVIQDRTLENRTLSFSVQGQKQKINKLKLADIIQARLEEWMEAVQYINAKIYPESQPPMGWFITGGASQLKNLDTYLSQEWKCSVKQIGPLVLQSSKHVFTQRDPAFSTVVSVLIEGGKIGPNDTSKPNKKEKINSPKKTSSGLPSLWADNAEYL